MVKMGFFKKSNNVANIRHYQISLSLMKLRNISDKQRENPQAYIQAECAWHKDDKTTTGCVTEERQNMRLSVLAFTLSK